MEESYGEGLATHTGPESCGAARKGGVEALTGVRAGRVLSRERNVLRDADAVGASGRLEPMHRYREVQRSPARSKTPSTHGNTSHGNREIPCSPGAPTSRGASESCAVRDPAHVRKHLAWEPGDPLAAQHGKHTGPRREV